MFDHATKERIGLSLQIEKNGGFFEHGVAFLEAQGAFSLIARYKSDKIDISVPITFPYTANQTVTTNLIVAGNAVSFTWNGITAQLPTAQQEATPEALAEMSNMVSLLNSPAELLRKMTMVPLRRGSPSRFTKLRPFPLR